MTTPIDETDVCETIENIKPLKAAPWKFEYHYQHMITFSYWHIAGLYGLYLCFTSAKWATVGLAFILYVAADIGVTAGAHRLWCHRAYKAKFPLQIILMLFNSLAFQNTVITWVRDHRLHHKYSDTDADPHNASRGFFFSHVGWIFVKKHPEVKKRGVNLDLSDIYKNPVLKFQKKYAIPVIGMIGFVLPTVIPIYFWEESFKCAWHITLLRFIANLNAMFLVNSAAHKYGNKPYDKNILPVQNIAVSIVTFGEGFHNYHHAFPWDYRTAELGNNCCNLTTSFIDFFAWLGWAYDLKTAPKDMIAFKAEKSGDGSGLWGWGEKDQKRENNDSAAASYKKDMFKKDTKVIRYKVYHGIIVLYCAVLIYANKTIYEPFQSIYEETVVLKIPLRSTEHLEIKLGQLPHHVYIYKLYYKSTLEYRAFCAGSIITTERVLSSSHCFLTNRKRWKVNLGDVKVAGGILHTALTKVEINEEVQQWRYIKRIYSQKFYRFPAYNLAVLQLKKPFIVNQWVDIIPYASKDQNFDGVCVATTMMPRTSWAGKKFLHTEHMQMLTKKSCERKLLRSCRLYYCTAYKSRYIYAETEGGGLICYGTKDPKETDVKKGLLVGVTALINIKLPTLHSRVGLFHKWISNDGSRMITAEFIVLLYLCVQFLNKLL